MIGIAFDIWRATPPGAFNPPPAAAWPPAGFAFWIAGDGSPVLDRNGEPILVRAS